MTGNVKEADTLADRADSSASDLELGNLFAGRYRIERCLGRGSMGTVYAAHDQVVNERIALKLLSLPRDESIDGFRREVRLARRVTHRNAVRTFDLGEHVGLHFITMEIIEGESLRVRLARSERMSPAAAMALAWQLCQGLQAAHDVGVIHRDLKPGNVLIDHSGRAVVTDFGVASTLAEQLDGSEDRTRGIGTPMYMAPEQILGAPLDGRVDVYALGLVLYEVLTGEPAFSGHTRMEIAMARLSRPPPDPRDSVELSDGLAELVLHCLAREPDDRPATPAVVADMLAALGASTITPSAPAASPFGGSSGSGSGSGGAPFVSAVPGDRKLAVMPFRYRGAPDHAYLADVLTDELVDLLAMTRGLRVSASGAASKFKDERDARTVGRALGVDAIIDGSILHGRDQIRIVARLIDVDTGFQRWNERFDGRMQDVLQLQDLMAMRVAEALRVELSIIDHGRLAPGDAVEHYLRGRQRAREPDVTGRSFEDAIALYDQALARAPGFALALAARAEAAMLRWFLPAGRPTDGWDACARDSVAAALDGASHLAETRLAAARLDVSLGQFPSAARHLAAALEIAPTCAAAHEYLGLLQCEAGRSREGVSHIELAHELDPSLHQGAFSVLRHHALRKDRAAWHEQLERMKHSSRFLPFAVSLFEYRLSLWEGDVERARAVRWRNESEDPTSQFTAVLRDALDPGHTSASLAARFDAVIGPRPSPRLRTGWRQIATEVLAWRGATALALEQLQQADAGGVLLDSDWFEACPLLAPLWTDPGFEATRDRIRARADAIWRTATP